MKAQPPTETSLHFHHAVCRKVAGEGILPDHRRDSLECL